MGKTSLLEYVRKYSGKSVVDTLTGNTAVRISPRKYYKKVMGETPSFDLGVFSQEEKIKKSNSRHAIPVVIDEGSVSKRNGKALRDDFEEEELVLKARKRSKVNHDTKSKENNKIDPDFGSRKDESDHKRQKFFVMEGVKCGVTHWQSYTDVEVLEHSKENLPSEQLNLFRESCFGYFLDLPPNICTQHQMINVLMKREMNDYCADIFSVEINSQRLNFGLHEFGIVTCQDNDRHLGITVPK
uniref:Uncharacterized protein n=1 Tax=Nicotiana tabacum TaxID=4097 RepID=A0A1S4D392_TOBAC|nr:PREDICTED: uncharacterized protein LOC107825500 [Nicotiana tabacum]